MTLSLDWVEDAARRFEKLPRRYATPGDLAVALDPTTRQTGALDVIDAALVDLVDGKGPNRLAIYMPPQEGKSQRCSRRFPEWLLEQDPTLRIGIVSYAKELAVRWGRDIKLDVEQHDELTIDLRQDSRAAGRWQTVQGGGVYCVGIGGGLTGQPIDVLIIDDPLADRAAAESELIRSRNWDWWENVGSTRLSKRGVVVLMMTRWHTDDLAGRFEQREPGRWKVVSIPAIADSPDDVLGREIGEELDSATKDPGYFTDIKSLRSPYTFSSIYQQSPTTAEGGLFKRAKWQYWHPGNRPGMLVLDHLGEFMLDDCTRFMTIDLAASKRTSADYTVGSAWAITPTGQLVLCGSIRGRVVEDDQFEFLAPLRQRWLHPFDPVYVEAGFIGTTLAVAAGRAGWTLLPLKADADKVTRALGGSSLLNQGRLWLPRWEGLDDWLDEHADFPNTAHDDQVDTTGYAARIAATHWLPPQSAAIPYAREQIAASSPQLDIMSIPI